MGLVVLGGVEGELGEEFAGVGVDDVDVQVLDEHQDRGSGVGSADADVVESAVVAQGDGADAVDLVGADPVVGVGLAAGAGAGFGPGRVRGGGSGAVLEGAVRAVVVVIVTEQVEQGL